MYPSNRFDRNKRKIKEYRTRTVSVNAASWFSKDKERREAAQRQKEEERRRQAKREEIAKAFPWIGDVVSELHEE